MTDFLENRLKNVLVKNGIDRCQCGHEIGFGDISWNNATSDSGTDHCVVEIECQNCQTEIVYFNSWYPAIDNRHDLVIVIENDLPRNNRTKIQR